VALSQQRLQEFIRAELVYFGQQIPEPLSLEQIVRASSPVKVARLLHRELPRRFAARVSHIESLEGWPDVEELCRLREIFMESFRQLRLANPPLKGTTSVQELENYSQVINQLRQRHKPVTALLGEALRKMRRNFEGPEKEQFINTWTDDFFCSRISTEMLTKHFVAIMNEPPNKASTRVGVVDTQCNPGRICQEAADQVLYSLGSSVHDMPELDIEVNATNCTHSGTDIEIPYIPMYLYYIVQELLRNSARATLEAGRKDGAQQTRPISVTVCSDQKQVAIRIADKGGGIPLGSGEKIWSYQFSTSIQPFEAYLDGASPLSGRGMGLPLGRLYASYLGGSLELMNMPGIGVDAYLFLNRIPNFDMAAFDTSRLGP